MKQSRIPSIWMTLVFFAAFTTAFSYAPGAGFTRQACAVEPNHAGMVIRFSEAAENERSWCLQFSQESLSGIEALRLTGLRVVSRSFGSEGEYVCKIGDVGTEAADCPAKDGSYWGYWRMTAEGWRHSGIGASSARVRCGSLEGWAWLQGGTGPAPSASAFRSICQSAACKESYSAVSPGPSAGKPPGQSAGPGPGTESGPGSLPDDGVGPDRNLQNGTQGGPDGGSNATSASAGPASLSPIQPPLAAREASNGANGATPAAGPGITSNAADKGPGEPGSTSGAVSSMTSDGRKTPWALYVGLGGLIVTLASVRTLLFRRNRVRNSSHGRSGLRN